MHRKIPINQNTYIKTLVIGIEFSKNENIDFDVLELASLCKTQGDEVVGTYLINCRNVISSTFITADKMEEIKEISRLNDVSKLVFNIELATRQKRNIMRITGLDVQDRHEVILNIFYKHAKTRTAKIEIELARLKFEYSRLVGTYKELSRTGGGIGTRGPGEQAIEYRRRELRERIKVLNNKLSEVRKNKKLQNKKRQKEFKCVLIGYTNSGKSSILNRLTEYHAKIQDELFATLDPITKKVHFSNEGICLITDTIGFIRNIPAELINSFYETLTEIREADLKLHIIDISSPFYREQIETVEEVVKKLGSEQESILVFNKIDLIYDENILKRIRERYPYAVFVSAKRNTNIDVIEERIRQRYDDIFEELTLTLEQCSSLGHILRDKNYLNVIYLDNGCVIRFRKIYGRMVREIINDIDYDH